MDNFTDVFQHNNKINLEESLVRHFFEVYQFDWNVYGMHQ